MKKNKFIKFIQFHQEGIIVGALTGLTAAYYLCQQGIDLNVIANSGKGLIDMFMSRAAPLELAKYKLYGTLVSVGALIGLIFDMIITRYVK